MSKNTSRPEGLQRIFSTLPDKPPYRVSVLDEHLTDPVKGNLAVRGIEAGPGIILTLADADSKTLTKGKKILIATNSAAGGEQNYLGEAGTGSMSLIATPAKVGAELILKSIEAGGGIIINDANNTLTISAAVPMGPQGPAGQDGLDGTMWVVKNVNPVSTDGNIGDYYFNYLTGNLYGPKINTGWGSPIGNLKGTDGVNGIDGVNGATWWSGEGDPNNANGKSGDFYIDQTNGDVFKKVGTNWGSPVMNIIGPTGAAGLDGVDGQDGVDGKDGLTWHVRQYDPAIPGDDTVGVNGDLWFNSYNGTIFRKRNGVWDETIGNIVGPTGKPGSEWFVSDTLPNTSIGVNNDVYLDTSTGFVYKRNSVQWNQLGTSIKGPTGPKGDKGDPGTGLNNRGTWQSGNYNEGDYVFSGSKDDPAQSSMWIINQSTYPYNSTVEPRNDPNNAWVEFTAPAGQDGSKWFNGFGTPSSDVGVIGDMYLNGTTGGVYEKTTASYWHDTSIVLKGPKGDTGMTGPAGLDGTQIFVGSATPSSPKVGDVWMRSDTGELYKRTSAAGGTWDLQGTFTGTDGATWHVHSFTTADDVWGVDGDYLMNTQTGDIFGPKGSGGYANSWQNTLVGNVHGKDANFIWARSSDPTDSVGNLNDIAINYQTGSLFVKENSTSPMWVGKGNIKGPSGNKWYADNIDPTSTYPNPGILKENDYFLNMVTGKIYGYTNNNGTFSWVDTGGNIKGPKGATIHSGNDTPSNSIGANGDYYFDALYGHMYGPKANGVWPSTYTDLSGTPGPAGQEGPAGEDGNKWLVAAQDPQSVDGVDGDYYMNSATGSLFGPKSSGAWGSSIGTLKGADGSSWLIGNVDPDNAQGKDGDHYLNTASGDIYGPKASGTWGSSVGNLNGNGWLVGSGDPTSGQGNVGDFYLNSTSGQIFGPKTNSGWGSNVGTLKGNQGVRGSKWYSGTSAPVDGQPSGVLTDDHYVNTTTGDVSRYSSGGAWVSAGNIQGPAYSFTDQNPHYVLAGPSSGSTNAQPAFRTLVPDDIPDLSAAKTTSGIFDSARIPDLDAAKITTGILSSDRIPSLDASKTTTGIFDVARIPNLDAAKVTTGVFDIGRIPNIPTSSISGLSTVAYAGSDYLKNLADVTDVTPITGNILEYKDATDGWILGTRLKSVLEDSSPTLGGTLNMNGQTVDGNILPNTTGQTLGDDTHRWAGLYLASPIHFNGNLEFKNSSGNTVLEFNNDGAMLLKDLGAHIDSSNIPAGFKALYSFEDKLFSMDSLGNLKDLFSTNFTSLNLSGGTTGQFLTKSTDNDYGFTWSNLPVLNSSGGNISGSIDVSAGTFNLSSGIPAGGSIGYVLTKNSATDYDFVWQPPGTAANGVPSGGTLNQVLTKKSSTDFDMEWVDAPAPGYSAKTARTVLAAPTSADGVPDFRLLEAADISTGEFHVDRIPILSTGKISGLGSLATKSSVDYVTEVTNKPTIPTNIMDLTGDVDPTAPTNGQVLQWSSSISKWVASSAGTGTVTSVDLTMDSFIDVVGSPITSSGTISATFKSQNQGLVFAAPVGASGLPTFRALEASDVQSGQFGVAQIPDLTASKITDLGTLATKSSVDYVTEVTNKPTIPTKIMDLAGDVDPTAPTNGQVLQWNSSTSKWVASNAGTGTVTSVALTMDSFMTVTGSPVTSSGTLDAKFNAQVEKTFLAGPVSGVDSSPTFRGIEASDLPVISIDSGTSGILSLARGGTGSDLSAGTAINGSLLVRKGSTVSLIADASGTNTYLKWNGTDFVWETVTASLNLDVQEEGSNVLSNPSAFNFVGPSVTATDVGGVATITVNQSVDLSMPAGFTVAGGPVTSTGTLSVTLDSQNAHSLLIAPTSSSGTPTWRTLDNSDLPVVGLSKGGLGTDLNALADNSLVYKSGSNFVGVSVPADGEYLKWTLANGFEWDVVSPSYSSQTARTVLAAPTSADGVPVFRALEASDVQSGQFGITQIPDLTASKITDLGTLATKSSVDYVTEVANKPTIPTKIMDLTGDVDPTAPTNGQVLQWNSSTSNWVASSAGTGTVTSVALTMDSFMTVTGSPVTSSGTLDAKFNTQVANSVFAGPSTGADASPNFRALVSNDIPVLDIATKTSGTLSLARGGTGSDLSGGLYNRGIIYRTGSTSALIADPTASGTFLKWDGTNFAWSTVDIGTETTGILSLARGGTGVDLSSGISTNGSILVKKGSAVELLPDATGTDTYLKWTGSAFTWATVTGGSGGVDVQSGTSGSTYSATKVQFTGNATVTDHGSGVVEVNIPASGGGTSILIRHRVKFVFSGSNLASVDDMGLNWSTTINSGTAFITHNLGKQVAYVATHGPGDLSNPNKYVTKIHSNYIVAQDITTFNSIEIAGVSKSVAAPTGDHAFVDIYFLNS